MDSSSDEVFFDPNDPRLGVDWLILTRVSEGMVLVESRGSALQADLLDSFHYYQWDFFKY